jgi:hypothetical protein
MSRTSGTGEAKKVLDGSGEKIGTVEDVYRRGRAC